MLPVSAQDVERFTPPGSDVTYLIATPTLLQRAAYRRDLVAAGAHFPSDAELLDGLRADLRDIAPANLDALLEIVDQFQAAGASADDDLAAQVVELETAAFAAGGRYAAARAARTHYMEIVPVIACRHFLVGWEGTDRPFQRRGGLTTDDTLASIPDIHLALVGFKALERQQVNADTEKNSVSPSPSPVSPQRSTAARKRPTARRGKSAATSTTATRN